MFAQLAHSTLCIDDHSIGYRYGILREFLDGIIMDPSLVQTHHCLRSLAHQYLNAIACSRHLLDNEASSAWKYNLCGGVKLCQDYPIWSWMGEKATRSQIVGKFRFCSPKENNPRISRGRRPKRQFDVRSSLVTFKTVLCTPALQLDFYFSFPEWKENNPNTQLKINLLILDCICCVVTVLLQS